MGDGGNVQNDCVGSLTGNIEQGSGPEVKSCFSEWSWLEFRVDWRYEIQLPIV